MSTKKWFAALVASALAVAWVNRRIRRWETLTPHDARDGEFINLPDGAHMHYTRCGEQGRDVILIHGFLGSAYDWFRTTPALAREYRAWAIDLIGFGYSERVTERTYSLKAYARSVREFMDAQGIARATLVGHSMGGAIALEFAHDYPDRADALVLVAPATYLAHVSRLVNLVARVPILPRTLIGLAITSSFARNVIGHFGLGDALVDNPEVSVSRRALRVKGTTDALVALIGSPGISDLVQGIGNISHPALIVSGDHDLVVPDWYCRQIATRLPNADLVILKNVFHSPQIEASATVNRLLLDFLREKGNLAT